MKKAINIRMDESLLTDLDSYASELERSRTYFDTLDEMISEKRFIKPNSHPSLVVFEVP